MCVCVCVCVRVCLSACGRAAAEGGGGIQLHREGRAVRREERAQQHSHFIHTHHTIETKRGLGGAPRTAIPPHRISAAHSVWPW